MILEKKGNKEDDESMSSTDANEKLEKENSAINATRKDLLPVS